MKVNMDFFRSKVMRLSIASLALLLLILIIRFSFPTFFSIPSTIHNQVSTSNIDPSGSIVESPNPEEQGETNTIQQVDSIENSAGCFVLSMLDGNYFHLYLYYPGNFALTRITSGDWDDIHPAINSDGTQLAFSSRQSGYFDIYIINLITGVTTRVTDTSQYDGHPSWSPDSHWLVYESLEDGNLELIIQSVVDLTQEPINLSNNESADFSPVWSPEGRTIAFVSTRSGDQDIWMAQLDQVEDRFINLSDLHSSQENYPAWSTDGQHLYWTSDISGSNQVYALDISQPGYPASLIGFGSQPSTINNSAYISVIQEFPGHVALTGYDTQSKEPIIALSPLFGYVNGIIWVPSESQQNLMRIFQTEMIYHAPELYHTVITLTAPTNYRFGVVPLDDVSAPYPFLQDNVDESFSNLRDAIGELTGWDFLASLENAYLPLTEPPTPGMPENWLLTGRAFTVNPLPLEAGWMVICREDQAGQTYWRIFLRAYRQDGSLGIPIREIPWNLNARFAGTPTSYEQGGSVAEIPGGYWVDFTAYAELYGWQRASALSNWRSFYQGAQFNLFIQSGGQDWGAAMREIYPSEVLATYTPIPTQTPTPTPTRRVTPTRTPTNTLTTHLTSTNANLPSLTPTP